MNYVFPVLTAAIASWMFGAAFYGLLGERWMAAQGWDEATKAHARGAGRQNVAPYVMSLIAEIVMAVVLAGVLAHMKLTGPANGLIVGGLLWLGFVATTIVVNNAYSMRRQALSAIDAGHWLGVLLIQGAVLGWWMVR